ncbi:hypothetical protein L198_06293 [Cryptococcus wingfieldii CBS 7118]|uniref:Uncharacterized protein n=1 Tax=Cryptococcus wingfieldii CBS 7118 TaxID=1295528 RepID=A0A1E3INV4_9TREE|nr:hypothetical protein L198_06293 [Cryptococcus wingfieldii CBS 7118]ODN89606.1 hypothetical protein L198_06293 [Cryptococcus wingfieldii CBS 7118]
MMHHFKKFAEILNDLEQLGAPMPEQEKIQVFFISLGNTYPHIRGSFISRPVSEKPGSVSHTTSTLKPAYCSDATSRKPELNSSIW